MKTRASLCRAALFETLERYGAITLEAYMAHCLTDARFGYYRHARIERDFVTAPCLSDAFGAIWGAWALEAWHRLGEPSPVMLVEAGPGHGQLLGDALRCARRLDERFFSSLSLHAIEINGYLRSCQARAWRSLPSVTWHEDLGSVPDGVWIFFANEFFDALPIRQYCLDNGRGFVRRVGRATNGGLRFVRGEEHPLPRAVWQREGLRILEVSPRASTFATRLAAVMARYGGAALLCDYGYASLDEAKPDGSLQAFRSHRSVDPLRFPGACDLSAEVDFASLAAIFSSSDEVTLGTQGAFLRSMGLANLLKGSAAQAILQRLTDNNAKGMGEAFKVLTALTRPRPSP